MAIPFNYKYFYDTYMNNITNNNIQIYIDNTPNKPDLYFYTKSYPENKQPLSKPWPNTYIIVSGINIYISFDVDDRLYFTIPYEYNGTFYDNHYHFGLTQITKNRKQITVVFFHETTQNPVLGFKNPPRNCYFQDLITINKVEDIICEQGTSQKPMSSYFIHDINIVKDILLRPWLGKSFKGGLLPSYKIFFGKNGVYTLKNNKKKYLTNNKKVKL
jgi:hypothetical protein